MFRFLLRFLKNYFFRHRPTIKEMIRYGIVGGFAAGIDFFFYVYLVFSSEYWKEHFLLAHTVSFLTANIFAFTFHKFWTFRGRKDPLAKQYSRYLIVTVGVFLLSDFLLYLFSDVLGVDLVVTKLVLVIIASGVSYVVNKFWTFNKRWYLDSLKNEIKTL
mgnify:CR=1 FL=1